MYRLYYSNPWNEMDRWLTEMNRAFGASPSRSQGADTEFPTVNMWSNENQVLITAELPGIDTNALEINTKEDIIVIQGKREAPPSKGENAVTYHRRERSCGKFKRVFKLPFRIDADKVEANYEKGVLRITLPRIEQDKPRKITISVK